MAQEFDLNKRMVASKVGGSPPQAVGDSAPNSEVTGMLDQVFDLIFNSSKQVLGNIMSIGIKYGDSLTNPDNMLVVFPNEVYGFQGWTGNQKRRWRYQRNTKTISKNGTAVQAKDQQSFVLFVQQGLEAMSDQNVKFSKNITTQELRGIA
ncbi:MAG: hypothetical protein VW397_01495 [Candidatus Margulisiibacteriota bacterium]